MKRIFGVLICMILIGFSFGCKANEQKGADSQLETKNSILNKTNEDAIKRITKEYIDLEINNRIEESELKNRFYSKNFWAIGGESLKISIVDSYTIKNIDFETDPNYGTVAYVAIEYKCSGDVDINGYKDKVKLETSILGFIKENEQLKILTYNGFDSMTKEGAMKFAKKYKDHKNDMYKKVSENILNQKWN